MRQNTLSERQAKSGFVITLMSIANILAMTVFHIQGYDITMDIIATLLLPTAVTVCILKIKRLSDKTYLAVTLLFTLATLVTMSLVYPNLVTRP